MANQDDHIACANRTQQTIAHLLGDIQTHSPWIAITAFYKALHVVEAVFANDSSIGHSSNHDERESILRGERRFENVFRHYSILKRISMNARYLSGCDCFDSYMTPQQVVDKLLKHHLHQVEQSAMRFLKQPANLNSVQDLFK